MNKTLYAGMQVCGQTKKKSLHNKTTQLRIEAKIIYFSKNRKVLLNVQIEYVTDKFVTK